MFTVLIQNQKTLQSFADYYPMFMQRLNKDEIDVCKWIESGTTCDTALLDLEEMVSDKEEWRAVIVRFEDDTAMKKYKSDPLNPYDFEQNIECPTASTASDIPLVRLTQILGGLPAPKMKFEPRRDGDVFNYSTLKYEPVELGSEEERAASEAKLGYRIRRPSSITLISVRCKPKTGGLSEVWKQKNEYNYSAFWERNNYPGMCRFVVYDFLDEGSLRKTQDSFSFWYTVLLMSTNAVSASSLQAYKLYNAKVFMNSERLEKTFNLFLARLKYCYKYVDSEIKNDLYKRTVLGKTIPEFEKKVNVPTEQFMKATPKTTGTRLFPFLRRRNDETSYWKRIKNVVEDNLVSAIRITKRSMDVVAEDMRFSSKVDPDEVVVLDKYQREDVLRKTNEYYNSLMEIQKSFPSEDILTSDDMVKLSKDIAGMIPRRTGKKAFLITFGALGLASLLCEIPALYTLINDEHGNLVAIILIATASVAVPLLLSWAILAIQSFRLRRLIIKYNDIIESAFRMINENASDYTAYMNAITSCSRGFSYCEISDKKLRSNAASKNLRYQHLDTINSLQKKIEKWGRSFYLNMSVETSDSMVNSDFNISIPPSYNNFYTFEQDGEYEIPINNSGDVIISPFSFAERFELKREELYDNADCD